MKKGGGMARMRIRPCGRSVYADAIASKRVVRSDESVALCGCHPLPARQPSTCLFGSGCALHDHPFTLSEHRMSVYGVGSNLHRQLQRDGYAPSLQFLSFVEAEAVRAGRVLAVSDCQVLLQCASSAGPLRVCALTQCLRQLPQVLLLRQRISQLWASSRL